MSQQKVDLLSEQGGAFLAPQEVGSAIQWHVTVYLAKRGYGKQPGAMSPTLNGSVNISDCSRWISWAADDEESVEKLDRAIAELKKARKALRKGLALYNQHATTDKGDE